MEKQLFAACGLNPTEQTVLLFLLEYGNTEAGRLAKRTGLKRPTVYSCLTNLEALGLVGRHIVKGATQFGVFDPTTIPSIFISQAKDKFQKVTQAALQLETTLKQYKSARRHRIGGYEISTLEKGEAMYAFLENVLIKGRYRGIFNPQTAFVGRGKEVGEVCLKATAKTKPQIREIAAAGPLCNWWINHIRNPNHIVLQVKMNQSLLTDILLFEDTVMLTNYDPDQPMAILIRHPDYYAMMVAIFDSFWNSLRLSSSLRSDQKPTKRRGPATK